MKTKNLLKKAFLLLALIGGASSAWGDVLCTAQVPTGQTGTFSNTEGIAQTGCTLRYSGLQGGTNTVTVNAVDYYKCGSDGAYVQLTLSSGSFQAGDVLTATVTSNGNNKSVNIKVNSSATSSVSVSSTETKDITYTLTAGDIESDGSIKIYRATNGSNLRLGLFSVSGSRTSYKVTFDAGSNGTCATSSLTGSVVELPSVTPNSGYAFNGWFTAASEGTKVGDAGDSYNPTNNVTLYAQYIAQSAPGISIDKYNPSTTRSKAITFTATPTGAPAPTVTWYQSATATTSGGTEKGTGLTYNPDVAAEGTYYYYAVASNGVGSDATSELITLTVTNPDIVRTGYNTYYLAKDDQPVGGSSVLCDNITMVYDDVTYNTAGDDPMISSLNSNYVSSVSSGTNGWGVTFTPSISGVLKVGVVANNGKEFSITNVTSFDYEDKDSNTGTIESNSWTPTTKFYGIVTIAVTAGQNYKFSVAGSKMSFYGFEFTPTVSKTISAAGWATYCSPYALDFTGDIANLTDAYIVTGATGSTLNLISVKGNTVAANTGILIEGSEGTVTIPVAASGTDYSSTNKLVGVTTATEISTNAGYVLMADPSLGFYKNASAFTVGANTAYLPADFAAGAARSAFFIGDVTGVEAVEAAAEAKAKEGKFIENGKLVIVKNGVKYNAAGAQVK